MNIQVLVTAFKINVWIRIIKQHFVGVMSSEVRWSVRLRLSKMTCNSGRACGSNTYIPEYGTAMSHNKYIIYQWYYLNSLCVNYNYLFLGMAFNFTKITGLYSYVPQTGWRSINQLKVQRFQCKYPWQGSTKRIRPHNGNGVCSWEAKCEYFDRSIRTVLIRT
jgi:hypothetical protein